MQSDGIIEHARNIGEYVLGPGLCDLASKHPSIGEIRGRGVFFALELVTDRESREPLAPYGGTSDAMGRVVAACRDEGMLIFSNYNRLHAVPPCTVTEDEVREGLDRLDRALDVADEHYVGAP